MDGCMHKVDSQMLAMHDEKMGSMIFTTYHAILLMKGRRR